MLSSTKRSALAYNARPDDGHPSLNYADISAAIEKRLFIGKVPPGTSDEEVMAIFSVFGVLKECRVVPDRGGNGNGIAFVSFDTWSAAHRAMLETDGKQQLRGHEGTPSALVASFAERTSNVGRGGGIAYAKGLDISRVFVGSLPEDATETELTTRFSAVGTVEGATMLPAKARLRCGYVTFQIWGEALDAVEALHGQPLRAGAEPMTVVLAQPKDRDGGVAAAVSRSSASALAGPFAPEPLAKWRRTEPSSGASDLLSQLLTAYAAAINGQSPASACDLIHDQIMKTREKLRGGLAGVADSNTRTRAAATVAALTGGSAGDLDRARLFVGGLPHDITDDDLASLAGQLSFPTLPLDSCKLLECRVLPGKGCGYLRYASWEAAEEAFSALQGRQVEGWTQVLRLQWASPRPASHSAKPAPAPAALAVAELSGANNTASQGSMDPLAFASQAEVEAQGLEPTRLFVGQIARECDAATALKPLFELHGQVQEFRWVQEKGVLYTSYSTFAEAQAAMRSLSNYCVPGVSKGLNVKFSQRLRRDMEPRQLR